MPARRPSVRPVAPPQPTQRGLSLIEGLVGLLVLSLGLVAALRLQTTFRLAADTARERSDAVRLAQSSLERLRATRGLGPDEEPDPTAFFTPEVHTAAPDPHGLVHAMARVGWTGRDGE